MNGAHGLTRARNGSGKSNGNGIVNGNGNGNGVLHGNRNGKASLSTRPRPLMDLPWELLQPILDYFALDASKFELAEASLVNKAFNKALKPALYRSASLLQNDSLYKPKTTLDNLVLRTLLSRRSDAVEFVRELDFKGDSEACPKPSQLYSNGEHNDVDLPSYNLQRETLENAFKYLLENLRPDALESFTYDFKLEFHDLLPRLLEHQKNIRTLAWNFCFNAPIAGSLQENHYHTIVGQISSMNLGNLTALDISYHLDEHSYHVPAVRAIISCAPNIRKFRAVPYGRNPGRHQWEWGTNDAAAGNLVSALVEKQFWTDVPLSEEDLPLVEPLGYNVLHSLSHWVPNQLTDLALTDFNFEVGYPRSPMVGATIGCLDLDRLQSLKLLRCDGAIHILKALTVSGKSFKLKTFAFEFRSRTKASAMKPTFDEFMDAISPGLIELVVIANFQASYHAAPSNTKSLQFDISRSHYFYLDAIKKHASSIKRLVLHTHAGRDAVDLDESLPREYLVDFFSSLTNLRELGIPVEYEYLGKRKPISYGTYRQSFLKSSPSAMSYAWLGCLHKLKYLHIRTVRDPGGGRGATHRAAYEMEKIHVSGDATFLATVLNFGCDKPTFTKHVILADSFSGNIKYNPSALRKDEPRYVRQNDLYPVLWTANYANRRVPAQMQQVLPFTAVEKRNDIDHLRTPIGERHPRSPVLERHRKREEPRDPSKDPSRPRKWIDVKCEILKYL